MGSYGQVLQPIPTGRFSLPGTYTQLMGAYPGRVEYAAQYAGQWDGNQLTLEITVVTLPQPVGLVSPELRYGAYLAALPISLKA